MGTTSSKDSFKDRFGTESGGGAVSPTPPESTDTPVPEEPGAGAISDPATATPVLMQTPAVSEPATQTLDPVEARQKFTALVNSLGTGVSDTGVLAIFPPFPPGFVEPVVGADLGFNWAMVHADPVAGMAVEVLAYDNMQVNDLVEVFWHPANEPTPIAVASLVLRSEHVGQDFDIRIPVNKAVVGFANWYLMVTRAGSQNGESSRVLTVFYKDVRPGGPDLKPDEPWHSELLAPQLELPAQLLPDTQVLVTIPAYPFMRVRDVITLSIGGELFSYTVQEGEVDNPLIILVTGAELEPIKDQATVHVVWRVHDEVLNQSEKWSAVTTLEPEFDNGDLLAPPAVLVNGTPVDTISIEALGTADAAARIRTVSPLFRRDDEIRVRCQFTDVEGNQFIVFLRSITVTDPNSDYDAPIANADLHRIANGQLRVSYEVYRNGVLVGRSQRRSLLVSGVVEKLPAPQVEEANGSLLPGNLASIRVSFGWSGMALGDKGLLRLSGTTADGQLFERSVSFSISSNEAGLEKKVITVSDNFSALNGGSLRIRYEVQPRSGGGELFSEVLELLVGAQQAQLPRPTVVQAVGNLMPPNLPATVVINYDAKDDDEVTLSWTGETAAASYIDTQLAQAGTSLQFEVPQTVVAAGLHQVIRVFYTVKNSEGVRLSAELQLIIAQAVDLDLVPPVSLEASAGFLNPAQVPATPGATFTVNYPGMLPLDQVQLLFSGATSFSSAVQTVSRPGTLTFHVPRSVILASIGQTIRVYYSLVRNGELALHSRQLSLQVNAQLSIASSQMVLDGFAAKRPDWPTTGLDFIGNTATRVPTGGVAPYRYVSNNPAIASVDTVGKVTGNRRGQAVITVYDSLNNSASYTVVVSNVWYVQVTPDVGGNHDYYQYLRWVTSLGGIVTIAHSGVGSHLWRVYGYAIPVSVWSWMGDAESGYGWAYLPDKIGYNGLVPYADTTRVRGGICYTPY